MGNKERKLGIWEKYLSLWVILCIVAGTILGRAFPQLSELPGVLEIEHISYLYSLRINPNDKYYQIPGKSQFPNPKEKE